jgi:hypothetical protein
MNNGNVIKPCDMLLKAIDPAPPNSKKTRIKMWDYVNIQTMKPTRTIIGAVTKEYPNGVYFNFCPFCGTRIDSPFANDKDE